MLSNQGIIAAHDAGLLDINPWRPDQLQPCSYDLRIGADVRLNGSPCALDMREYGERGFLLMPQALYLLTTEEVVTLSPLISGRVEGRSSWGRRGLLIHFTAGFIDAGFSGQITLEVCNLSRDPLWIKPGDRLAQITFTRLESPADPAYGDPRLGSHYQHQRGPTPARGEVER